MKERKEERKKHYFDFIFQYILSFKLTYTVKKAMQFNFKQTMKEI